MIDFLTLFSWDYLVNKNPDTDFVLGFPILFFFVVVFLVPGLLKKLARSNKYLKKSLKKKLWPFKILAVIGIILIIARFSEVPFFSMRLFLLVTLLITLLVTIVIGCKIYFSYSKRVGSAQREKQRQ